MGRKEAVFHPNFEKCRGPTLTNSTSKVTWYTDGRGSCERGDKAITQSSRVGTWLPHGNLHFLFLRCGLLGPRTINQYRAAPPYTENLKQIAPEALDQLIRIIHDNLAHLIHCSDHTSCFRVACNDGERFLSLCLQYGSTSHLWLSSTWNVASNTEAAFYMYLILINLNSHMWLVYLLYWQCRCILLPGHGPSAP